MPRPILWSHNLHPLRDQATRSRTQTWSRQDLQRLFGCGRASAQNLMKAIGGIQTVGMTHFVDRASLLRFLDNMVAAESVEEAFQQRLAGAEPPPRPRPLRIPMPVDLRHAMLGDLPPNITLSPGRIEITAETATAMVEALFSLAAIMQNDLHRWQNIIEPPPEPTTGDDELRDFLAHLRQARC